MKGGGSILGLQATERGRGSNFGPNVNKPISWAKKGGLFYGPPPPDPPHIFCAHTQRRSQVSLAGGAVRIPGGGDKPQYL